MTEIRIRNCNIHVVRKAGHGGLWSSLADRKALAKRAQELVLGALDEWLERLLGRHSKTTSVPLALGVDIDLSMADLSGPLPFARQNVRELLFRALDDSVAAPVSTAPAQRVTPDHAGSNELAERDSDNRPRGIRQVSKQNVLELVTEWHREGTLVLRLKMLGIETLVLWYRQLLRNISGQPNELRTFNDAPPLNGPAQLAARNELYSRADIYRKRLIACAQVAAEAHRTKLSFQELEELEQAFPLPPCPEEGSETDERFEDPATFPKKASGPESSANASAPPDHNLPMGRYGVETALPFILLCSLQKAGILDAWDASFRISGNYVDAATLAFALALKTLKAPDRGWHYSKEGVASACIFAGLVQRPNADDLAAMNTRLAGHLELSNAAAAASLVEGHSAHQPYLLLSMEDKVILFEPEGQFPVMTAPDIATLIERLGEKDSAIFLEPSSTLHRLMDALDRAGWTGFCEGDPGRGEAWRSILGQNRWRGMSNVGPTGIRKLATLGPKMSEALIEARLVWQELRHDRPIIPGKGHEAVEESLAIAVALGLGTISWRLYERNPGAWMAPDPLLALARFSDLTARVDVLPDQIAVTLPLGPRFADLRATGLIDTVPTVPWWGGRPVTFGGG